MRKITQKEENIVEAVLRAIKENFNINVLSHPKNRQRDLVDLRGIAMKIIKDNTNLTYEAVGKLWANASYAGKDHSSILHNIKKADTLIETDFHFSNMYNIVLDEVQKIIPRLKPDVTIYQEISNLQEENLILSVRDEKRKELIISLQREVNRIPHRYQEDIIKLFKAEEIYSDEDQNIFI